MPIASENVLVINGSVVFPSLVLAGGFVYKPGVGIVPIPNGVEHAGQVAISAVISLRQYATVAATPEIRNALNSAADDLARSLAGPIASFQSVLADKLGKTIGAAG